MPGIHQDVHLSAVPAISSGVSPSVPVQLCPGPPPPPLSTPQLSGRAAWCRAPAAEGWPPPRSLLSPCVPGASTEDYALLSPIFQDCIAWHGVPLDLVTKLHIPIVAGLQTSEKTTNWVSISGHYAQSALHSREQLKCLSISNAWHYSCSMHLCFLHNEVIIVIK